MSFVNAHIVGKDVVPEDYFAENHPRGSKEFTMTSSALRLFGHCSSRWKAGYVAPETSAKDLGSLFDCLALTPAQFDKRYAVHPETYQVKGMECPKCGSITDSKSCRSCGEDRIAVLLTKPWNWNSVHADNWKLVLQGREPLSKSEHDGGLAAVARLESDPILQPFLAASDRQVWVAGEWEDKSGLKVPVKALIDLVPRNDTEFPLCLGDLKSCRNAALPSWWQDCRKYGYFLQSAFHMGLFNAATGENRDTWCFLLLENYPPYEPGRRILSQDYLNLGRAEVDRLMTNYCACVAANKWPGYDDGPLTLQGWSLVEPNDGDKAQALVAPRYDFEEAEEEAAQQEEEPEGITP